MDLPYNKWKDPGTRTSSLTHTSPPTHSWSFHSPKLKKSWNNGTQLDSLTWGLLHNIGMWYVGIAHHNKLKPFLVQPTQQHPVVRAFLYYKLKYASFDYFMHYYDIKYAWADIQLCPHKSSYKWGKEKIIKHDPI